MTPKQPMFSSGFWWLVKGREREDDWEEKKKKSMKKSRSVHSGEYPFVRSAGFFSCLDMMGVAQYPQHQAELHFSLERGNLFVRYRKQLTASLPCDEMSLNKPFWPLPFLSSKVPSRAWFGSPSQGGCYIPTSRFGGPK